MFGRRKISADMFTNLISSGTIVEGKMTYTGALKIQGMVRGDVRPKDNEECDLIVDNLGTIIADYVGAANAIVIGHIETKELWVEDTLRITSSAKIEGADIYYRNLEIEPGAVVNNCKMHHLDHTSKGEVV